MTKSAIGVWSAVLASMACASGCTGLKPAIKHSKTDAAAASSGSRPIKDAAAPDAAPGEFDGGVRNGMQSDPSLPGAGRDASAADSGAETNPAESGGAGGSGGGGSGGSGPAGAGGSGANAPPTVTIDFPPPGLSTLGVLHARGRVTDPDGDAIDSLTVHGTAAAVSGDSWSAQIALDFGDNDLRAQATDARGAVATGPTTVVNYVGALLEHPLAFTYDVPNQRAFVYDEIATQRATEHAIYVLDLMTSQFTLVSGTRRGSGPGLTSSRMNQLVFDAPSNSILLLDPMLPNLMRVDVATGARTIISDANTPAQGGGPLFQFPLGLALDSAGRRIFISDVPANALFAVDLTTGARSVVSDSTTGVALKNAVELAYDAADQAVFSGDGIRFRLSDGSRTQVMSANDGHGYALPDGVGAPFFDDSHHSLILVDSNHVVELDPTTLTRRLIADPSLSMPVTSNAFDPTKLGTLSLSADQGVRIELTLDPSSHYVSSALQGKGPAFTPYSLVMETPGKSALVVDATSHQLIRVDLPTGDRSVISAAADGLQPTFQGPDSVALDSASASAYVVDGVSLLAVELSSGKRSTMSTSASPAVGSGPQIAYPGALSDFVDTSNHRVILASGQTLLAIDLTNGNRSEFSGPGRGNGHLPPTQFLDVVYEPPRQRYLAIGDDDQVLAIDPTSGDRTVVSGSLAATSGPALVQGVSIGFDATNDSAVVADYGNGNLIAIDLDTGNRHVVQTTTARSVEDIAVDGVRGQVLFAMDSALLSVDLSARASEILYTRPQRNSLSAGGNLLWPAMDDLGDGYAYAFSSDGIVRFDLAQGTSDDHPTTGDGAGLLGVAFSDPRTNTLYGCGTASMSGAELVSADLSSYVRRLVSDPNTGSGPSLNGIIAGVVDSSGKLLVLDSGLGAVFGIDPSTGDRTNLSGGPVGTGDQLSTGNILFMAYDAATKRAFVVDQAIVVAVDLTTGNRTPFSGNGAGTGPALMKPRGITFDPVGRRAIVREMTLGAFIAIDADTGNRTMLAPDLATAAQWTGYSFWQYELGYDPARHLLFTGDAGHAPRSLLEVDELTGDFVTLLGVVP